MTSLYRAKLRRAAITVLPLLMTSLPADAATPRRGRAPATGAAKPVRATNTIINLPLQPVLPAGQRLCAARTPSGLGYTVLRPGSGPKPAKNDTVLVNYIGYLAAAGSVFDQGMQSPLPLDKVIKGFSEGLQMIPKTGIVRLCIPAAMGYGARATGPIPANADLVFQVELLDIKTAAEMEDMRKAQPADADAQKDAPPQP